MTELDLDAIEARAAAATPGPWEPAYDSCDCIDDCTHAPRVYAIRIPVHITGYEHYRCTGDSCHRHTATKLVDLTPETVEFIVHARSDVPQLVEAVRALLAERDRLAAALADRQTLAAVYGYELGLADAAGTDTNPPTSGE